MNKFNKTRLITHFAILKRDGHENWEENGEKREEKK
jgi:hypothetical protein